MAKGKRICKICGAEYEYCRTMYRDTNIFRWQDVCCCQSHGSEYFAKVMASRATQTTPNCGAAEAPFPTDYADKDGSSEIGI